MLDRGTEGKSAQFENDIADNANGKTAPDPIETPVGDADEQHYQPDEQAG